MDTLSSLRHARPTSYWLDRPMVRTAPEQPDIGGGSVHDMVVVGAGLTGLWAAFEASMSGRDVLVIDRDSIGGGASGRCGGFINSSITHGVVNGHARWPDDMPEIVALQDALWADTLRLLESSVLDGVIEPFGKITVATRPHHIDELRRSVHLLDRYGQDARFLDSDLVRGFVNSPKYLAGVQHRSGNGLCDPIHLAMAVAQLASGAGARIATGVAVDAVSDAGTHVELRLSDGRRLRASSVLLATNAYPPLWRRLRRRVVPVYDHVIATEPLSAEHRSEIGWSAPIGVTDAGNQFHYYRRTPTGGILFGGWDVSYHFGGDVHERHETSDRTHQLLTRHLLETFPSLEGITITHRWGGPIDVTSRLTPTIGSAMGGRLAWALGFTGLGVGASRFAGAAAVDVLSGRRTPRTELPLVSREPIPFPPEPIRTLVISATRRALAQEDRTGRRGPWLRFLDRIGISFDT